MGFEDTFAAAIMSQGFGKERFLVSYKDRPHISKSKLDRYSEALYIGTGELSRLKFSEIRQRYIAAMDVTYDLMLTIYDVNTSTLLAARLFGFPDKTAKEIDSFVRGLGKKANLEARLIGLQNNESTDSLSRIFAFLKSRKIQLVEIDVFGNEIRHIAVDSKIGVPYNILKDNRIYRPGELTNTATIEQFEKGIRKTP